MRHYLGIDGGGTSLRVVIVDQGMQVVAQAKGASANPNAIGRQEASNRVQALVRECLVQHEGVIAAAGIGIAGAAAAYAADWLRATLEPVLPGMPIVPSSDHEIALTGAMGQRAGQLLVAGTGSVAYGITQTGEAIQVGGWGYLLGDEGSGYWIGRSAVQHVIQMYDAGQTSDLWPLVCVHFDIQRVQQLIEAIYLSDNLVPKLAALVPTIFEAAKQNNSAATDLVDIAAEQLSQLVLTLRGRMAEQTSQIAFAGSLIGNDTVLRRAVCDKLGVAAPSPTRYPPVVGAALLAALITEDRDS